MGTVVCKIDEKKSGIRRGYIAMLVVIKPMRGKGIGWFIFFTFLNFNNVVLEIDLYLRGLQLQT